MHADFVEGFEAEETGASKPFDAMETLLVVPPQLPLRACLATHSRPFFLLFSPLRKFLPDRLRCSAT
jgi:hypothetical protein